MSELSDYFAHGPAPYLVGGQKFIVTEAQLTRAKSDLCDYIAGLQAEAGAAPQEDQPLCDKLLAELIFIEVFDEWMAHGQTSATMSLEQVFEVRRALTKVRHKAWGR